VHSIHRVRRQTEGAKRLDPRLQFKDAQTFVVYYGTGRLEEIVRFDVAILEGSAYGSPDVRKMVDRGCIPLGYLSCLESGEHIAYHRNASPADFLTVGGIRLYKEEFRTWMMDPRSDRWQKLVLDAAGRLIDDAGFHGLFLDTLGDVEDPSLPRAVADEITLAAAHLVLKIRRAYPEAVIVQNSGLGILLDYTAPLLDAVCWESFRCCPREGGPDFFWGVNMVHRLAELRDSHGTKVMLLSRSERGACKKDIEAWAGKYGFMHYVSPPSYAEGIIDPRIHGSAWASPGWCPMTDCTHIPHSPISERFGLH